VAVAVLGLPWAGPASAAGAGATGGTAVVGADEAAPTAAPYRVIDLGVGSAQLSGTSAFGSGGLIAGMVFVDYAAHTAIWRPPGSTEAEVVGPANSTPIMVGPRGEVLSLVPGDNGGGSVVRWWRGEETQLGAGMVGAPTPVAVDGRGRVLLVAYDYRGAFEARLTDGRRTWPLPGLPEPHPPSPSQPQGDVPYLADMNDRGEIVGAFAERPGEAHTAFVWRDGALTWLPTLPDSGAPATGATVARGIDARGVIVGSATTDGGTATHPVLWRRGRIVDLGLPDGAVSCYVRTWSEPLADGYILGSCSLTDAGDSVDFVWHAGTYTLITDPTASLSTVNARGQVAGTFDVPDVGQRAFVWDDGVVTELGTLGGPGSSASDIDEQGRVIGSAQLPDGTVHAVVWVPRR
jgi:probable HAF family extracellular repeat protein